jgi:uncharacterized repeat protein (TIGR03803 family)
MLLKNSSSRLAMAVLATTLAITLLANRGLAQTEKLLYRFTGSTTSGQPNSGFIADRAGNLYGTANLVNGAVFELSPPTQQGGSWTESVLYFFQGGSDGFSPSGSKLVMDTKGILYGSNAFGGTINSVCPQGCGTVYQLSPQTGGTWSETVLYRFPGQSGGVLPTGITLLPNGWLVGAAMSGGDAANDGLIFGLQAPSVSGGSWTKHILYKFQGGSDGSGPDAPLLADKNGNLFSTTQTGGSINANCSGGCGTIFELTPPTSKSGLWTKTTLYNFQGGATDGALPEHGLIPDASGNLYGTTFQGGPSELGTAFELSPPAQSGGGWTETTLHTFNGPPDGIYPNGVVVDQTGNLYGATAEGGTGLFEGGILYELSPPAVSGDPWAETILHNFPSTTNDGSEPESPLLRGGTIYGVTFFGGGTRQCSAACGTFYTVRP